MSGQVELPLRDGPVEPATLRQLATINAAIDLCVRVSGKDYKQAYLDLGIDKGHWSKIVNGQCDFPSGKLEPLMEKMGNLIPLEWQAYRFGQGLHPLETALERENRELREENETLKREREIELRLLKDLRA